MTGPSRKGGDRWMPTMKDMAREYREASARLALRIAEMKRAGAPAYDIRVLYEVLTELRTVQRTLDGYYTTPRAPEITSAGWYANRETDG